MGAIIMRLDFKSLAFGYSLKNGVATPAWETSLGQGKGYKINNKETINELVKGLVYKAVPPKTVSYKKGRGGTIVNGDADNSGLVISAVFDRVFINDREIFNGQFILVVIKDDSESHKGRLKLKYGPDNRYTIDGTTITNNDFISKVRSQLGLSEDACWFVSDISVVDQDQLILKTTIINKDGSEEYIDSTDLHNAWDEYYDSDSVGDNGTDGLYGEIKVGENIIFYGVPGSGKSYKIKTEYCNDENYMERVVFHPDYTYSDFVGQILPENENGHISYPFIAGPFTRIMKKAEEDKNNNYYLVIEELNRGNAPAIFGEIFQLLDREDGISEYGINNTDIARIVYGDENHLVKIPRNLFILATMNTADQNVFTLDTAFKRRWKMQNVPSVIEDCSYASEKIGDTDISWAMFLEAVNPIIVECGEGNIGSEDKRLGAYFVKLNELQNRDFFSEKVLMYLWNDAFKYNHEKVFKEQYKTLEEVIKGFRKDGFDIFAKDVKFSSLLSTIVANNGATTDDNNA